LLRVALTILIAAVLLASAPAAGAHHLEGQGFPTPSGDPPKAESSEDTSPVMIVAVLGGLVAIGGSLMVLQRSQRKSDEDS
jgi:hypothetical protein